MFSKYETLVVKMYRVIYRLHVFCERYGLHICYTDDPVSSILYSQISFSHDRSLDLVEKISSQWSVLHYPAEAAVLPILKPTNARSERHSVSIVCIS